MTDYTLTAIDTSGIQDYVFSSNNLRQNAGASYLVKQATGKWVENALPEPHNVRDIDSDIDPFKQYEGQDDVLKESQLQAEVLYAGGGNVLILFAEKDQALAFTKKLTQRVMLEAPGLRLLVTHLHHIDWATSALGGENGATATIMKQLDRRKREFSHTLPVLGLGVTATCVFTGLPATTYDQDNRPISSESQMKLKAEKEVHKELLQLLNLNQDDKYEIPHDFEELGSTRGESSYIAIVHADGNHMGDRIKAIQTQFSHADQNRAYITDMRSFSLNVKQAASKALQRTVHYLIERIKEKPDPDKPLRTIYTIGNADEIVLGLDKDGKKLLPFRPIVFGGDDATFVCDGRLGLSLAKHYLEVFRQHRPDGKHYAHCRAGVAVVHTHYPFARAYDLAEALCKSAKNAIKEWEKDTPEDGVTALDWHFAVSGLIRDLEDTRKHEYTSRAGIAERKGTPPDKKLKRTADLLMRPLRLNDPDLDWQSWQTFAAIVEEFSSETWQTRRNKLKDLRDVLRQGSPDAVKQFRQAFVLPPLPKVPQQNTMPEQGWQGNNCGYFDAIEAMDNFIDLDAIKLDSSTVKEGRL